MRPAYFVHYVAGWPRLKRGNPADVPKGELDSGVAAFEQSPRATHLRYAAKETMIRADVPAAKSNFQQPLPLLLQSLRPFSPDMNEDVCFVRLSFTYGVFSQIASD